MTGTHRNGAPAPPNGMGFEAPECCYLPIAKDLPPIAVPARDKKQAICSALVTGTSNFDAAITHIVLQSHALKAWFAFRIAHRSTSYNPDSTLWAGVHDKLNECSNALASEYEAHNKDLPLTNVALRVATPADLQARAIYVLSRKFRRNATNQTDRGSTLMYHPYYQTHLEKLFLAYRLLYGRNVTQVMYTKLLACSRKRHVD